MYGVQYGRNNRPFTHRGVSKFVSLISGQGRRSSLLPFLGSSLAPVDPGKSRGSLASECNAGKNEDTEGVQLLKVSNAYPISKPGCECMQARK